MMMLKIVQILLSRVALNHIPLKSGPLFIILFRCWQEFLITAIAAMLGHKRTFNFADIYRVSSGRVLDVYRKSNPHAMNLVSSCLP